MMSWLLFCTCQLWKIVLSLLTLQNLFIFVTFVLGIIIILIIFSRITSDSLPNIVIYNSERYYVDSQSGERHSLPQLGTTLLSKETPTNEDLAHATLHFLRRLKLYEEILQKRHGTLHKDHFNCDFYTEFRKKSLLELAINFANQGDTVALTVLFERESTILSNHFLVIISNFPETLPPLEYKNLMDILFSLLDSKTVIALIHSTNSTDEFTTGFDPAQVESDFRAKFYNENENFRYYIINQHLSEEMLASWLKERALEILDFTSLVDNSLQLLRYGMDQSLNVAELYHELDLYSLLIYESAQQSLPSFKDFEKMTVIDKMNLILKKHEASYAIENLFEKFIEKLSKNENNLKVNKKTLLREFMINLTKNDFKQCLSIFESCSMANKTLEQIESMKIICDACDLVELAIDCIRAYEDPANLEFAFRIMECLPERSQAAILMGDNASRVRQFNRVNDQADQIEYYLTIIEVLRDYGTNITVKDLEAIVNSKTATAAQMFFEKVMKNFLATSFSATVDISSEWKNFFWNLQNLRKNSFKTIASEELVELCVHSLLFSGKKVYIQLALQHISLKNSKTSSKKVSHEKGREMLKKAATDYIKFANPIQDDNLELASICLMVFKEQYRLDDDDEILEELDLINGLYIMYDDFNFDMLPIKVKQHAQPRIDLIETLLKCSKNSYAQVEKVLRLSKLLRVCKADSDEKREGVILSMIGKEAINEGDYQAAHHVCQMILQRNLQHGWDLCYLFAKLPYLQDVMTLEQQLDYLSFALAYCPETDIEVHFSILHEIKSIKLTEKNGDSFIASAFNELKGEQSVR